MQTQSGRCCPRAGVSGTVRIISAYSWRRNDATSRSSEEPHPPLPSNGAAGLTCAMAGAKLLLDSNVRVWVMVPIVFITFFMGVLRH
ncbi:unnamed protein product [Merluccius merluccius]